MTDAAKIQMLLSLLDEIQDSLSDEVDVEDGGADGPIPNKAMRIITAIEEVRSRL